MAITKATASAVAPAAKGDLVVGSAANDAAVLGVGTDGQYLTAASTTATGLQWSTLSAGGMTVLASGSLSSTGVNLTSISGAYKDLVLYVRSFTSSSGQGQIRLNGDRGTNYRLARIEVGSTSVISPVATTQFNMEYADSAATLTQIQMIIRDYANTGKTNQQVFIGVSRALSYAFHWGCFQSSAAISSLNIFGTSSTLAGTYVLYGVN